MKAVFTIFLALFILACSNTSKVLTSYTNSEKALLGDTKVETADYTIQDARIEKNQLILIVNFSGGCESFKGQLIGSKFLMKSLPPKRPVKFILKKNGDCREFKTEQFVYDISNLAYKKEDGSEVVLLVEGFEKPLSYVYVN